LGRCGSERAQNKLDPNLAARLTPMRDKKGERRGGCCKREGDWPFQTKDRNEAVSETIKKRRREKKLAREENKSGRQRRERSLALSGRRVEGEK